MRLQALTLLTLSSLILVGCSPARLQPSTEPSAGSDKSKTETAIAENTAEISEPAILLTEIEVPQIAKKPVPVVDVWQRIRAGMQLDFAIDNRRIRMQRNWYARHQDYLDRVADRSRRYLYDVVERIEARELPMELALLPIVESAYDPFAYSHGRASGMWQFIPGTGKRYSMPQNWWYDGRRDVVASTEGALDYLTALHRMFDGDWLLALAAYNSGQGNVRKAVRANRKAGKPTDFWALNLPRETKAYVPKLIALVQLLAQSEKYGVRFKPVPNEPYFARVDIGSQLDLAQAAELAEIPLEELYLLNPGFNQWATSPKGPHLLNIPVEKADTFKTKLAQLPKEKRISWIRYKIRSGDSLSTIAKKYRTSTSALKQINRLSSSRIRAGKVLFIPTASKSSDHYVLSAAQRLQAKQQIAADTGLIKQVHSVRSGESFWTLSRKYGVGMRQIAKWNGMATRDPLSIGKKLIIWTKPAVQVDSSPAAARQIIRKVGYKVRSGDSLARIANKFNVSIADIEGWNGITRKKYLQPGQSLKLYVDITKANL